MTIAQLKEGKRLRREIKFENDFLRRQQFDVEMGGRDGPYAKQEEGAYSTRRAEDIQSIERTQQRIEKLETQFDAL